MTDLVAEFICSKYADAQRIVEIGVGRRASVAMSIANALPKVDMLVTDVDEDSLRQAALHSLRTAHDDALHPRVELYRGAGLIYSVRPPPELVPALEWIARAASADLLVIPRSGELFYAEDPAWTPVRLDGRVLGWLRSHRVSPRRVPAPARPIGVNSPAWEVN